MAWPCKKPHKAAPRAALCAILLIIAGLALAGCWGNSTSVAQPGSSQTGEAATTAAPLPVVTTEEDDPQATSNGEEEIQEYRVQELPLSGPAVGRQAELSGLAWYGDWLIMLPQYPGRFDSGSLFALHKTALLDAVSSQSSQNLEPVEIPFDDGGLGEQVKGFEGFECIVFYEDHVYLSIEAQPKQMLGYLVQGAIQTDAQGTLSIQLFPDSLVEIPPQTGLDNYSDESCLVYNNRIISLYEANGVNVNPAPQAHVFSLDLQPQSSLPLPNIEYRLTDATQPDAEGRFWAINYLFSADALKLKPAETGELDALAQQYGEGQTHSQYIVVERLVQFQIVSDKIELVNTPPIQLELIGDASARNWEGLVRLDERGFLMVTDSFPKTMLGFVAYP